MVRIEKLVGGQERVEHPGAVVVEHLPPPQRKIDEGGDPALAGRVEPSGQRGQRGIARRAQPRGQPGDVAAPHRQFGGQRGGRFRQALGQLQRAAPRGERGERFALAFEQLREAQLRDEIGAIEAQRAVQRGALLARVAGEAVRVREIAPQRARSGIGGGGLREGSDRRRAVARAQRGEARTVGAARGVARDFASPHRPQR